MGEQQLHILRARCDKMLICDQQTYFRMRDLTTFCCSGNLMGDAGARLLAKALQINSKLRTIIYDRNNITLQGYCDIAYALER
jgi:hypothetical protein